MSITNELQAVVADAHQSNPQLPEMVVYEAALSLLTPEQQVELSEEISAAAIQSELAAAAVDTGEKNQLLLVLTQAITAYHETKALSQEWSDRAFELSAARSKLMRRASEVQAKSSAALNTEVEAQLDAIRNSPECFQIRKFTEVDRITAEARNIQRSLSALVEGGMIVSAREVAEYWSIRQVWAEAEALAAMASFLDFCTQERAASANWLQGGGVKIDTSKSKSGLYRERAQKLSWNYNSAVANFKPTMAATPRFN